MEWSTKKPGYYLRYPVSSLQLLVAFTYYFPAHLRGTFAYLQLLSLEIQPYNPRNDSSYKRNAAAHRTVDQVKTVRRELTLQQTCRKCWELTLQCSILPHGGEVILVPFPRISPSLVTSEKRAQHEAQTGSKYNSQHRKTDGCHA